MSKIKFIDVFGQERLSYEDKVIFNRFNKYPKRLLIDNSGWEIYKRVDSNLVGHFYYLLIGMYSNKEEALRCKE